MQFFPYVLFLHVFGAILAFGPTYAYSIGGAMGGREPQHANFNARVGAATGSKLVYPLAILQGITGLALVLITGINILSHAWLTVAIILYLGAISFALTIQRNTLHQVIEMTSTPPPAGATGGPPPALMAAVKRLQMGGMGLGLTVAVIVFLMVVKPGG